MSRRARLQGCVLPGVGSIRSPLTINRVLMSAGLRLSSSDFTNAAAKVTSGVACEVPLSARTVPLLSSHEVIPHPGAALSVSILPVFVKNARAPSQADAATVRMLG